MHGTWNFRISSDYCVFEISSESISKTEYAEHAWLLWLLADEKRALFLCGCGRQPNRFWKKKDQFSTIFTIISVELVLTTDGRKLWRSLFGIGTSKSCTAH